jgi:hypothetical protein
MGVDMEELYIKVEKGQVVDHPIAGWNLRMFYPDLDPENPPKGFERFTRLPLPELDQYQKLEGVVYEKTNYGWQDKYIVSEMTNEEKAEFDEKMKMLNQIKSYPETTLKKVSKLIENGKLDNDPFVVLDYLKNN